MYNDLEQYFQTVGKVNLPGIDEEIGLPDGVWFRYDGEVPSLAGNLARTELIIKGMLELNRSRLMEILEWPMDMVAQVVAESKIREKIKDIDKITAYCFPHLADFGLIRAYVIARKGGLNESRGLFADGHESGEFLQAVSAQKIMQGYLDREGVGLNVKSYRGEEFADLGGLLALRKSIARGVPGILVPEFKTRPPVLPEQVKAFGL